MVTNDGCQISNFNNKSLMTNVPSLCAFKLDRKLVREWEMMTICSGYASHGKFAMGKPNFDKS